VKQRALKLLRIKRTIFDRIGGGIVRPQRPTFAPGECISARWGWTCHWA